MEHYLDNAATTRVLPEVAALIGEEDVLYVAHVERNLHELVPARFRHLECVRLLQVDEHVDHSLDSAALELLPLRVNDARQPQVEARVLRS